MAGDAHDRMNGDHDSRTCEEIARLIGQVSKMSWDLVTPFKEFQAGKIDAAVLRQRTAEPEVAILRDCLRVYELATEIEDAGTREKAVNLAAAVLQRQRGFSMMIEGIAIGDESRIARGEKLFEEGRNQAIASVLAFTGSDSPHAAQLKRLLDAYDPHEDQHDSRTRPN